MQALMMQPEDIRSSADAAFAAAGWPGRRTEAFRYTPLDSLAGQPWPLAKAGKAVRPAVLSGLAGPGRRLVFEAGLFQPSASDPLPDGWQMSKLSQSPAAYQWLASRVATDHPAQLALARAGDGWLLELASGIRSDEPVILDVGGGENQSLAPLVLVVRIGEGAAGVLAEYHHGDGGLSVPLIGLDLAAGARLDQAKYQQDDRTVTHIGLTVADLQKGSDMAGFVLAAGAGLSRCETDLQMLGEQGFARLSSLYLGRDAQHHDITTRLHHARPNCRSEQLIKGVLDDRAKGVFQGQIRVAPDAQQTDGQQMSRALLLSRDAEANTKPELEIFADDVACSHGATIGELEADQLFYLLARGIPPAEARSLLVEAFIHEALDQIRQPLLADWLAAAAASWRQPV